MQSGVVVARNGDAAIVAVDGRDRLVLVGLGTVFARTTADEAAELDLLAATALGATPPISTERGT